MYLAMKTFQLEEAAERYEKEEKQKKLEEEASGPLVYAVPFLMEYTVVSVKDISRLKAYIRSSPFTGDVLQKAGKKGFPLYFQLFRRPFTKEKICDILINGSGERMENKPIIHCFHYDQVIHIALCISRNLVYPKKTPASPYYSEVKERLKRATDRQEKKKLRRELKRHSPIFDPYPKCRSCIMARELINKSCLGAEFDLEDKECLKCSSRKECCQLMRLRIESILEGKEDEVIKDILREWKKVIQYRKEVKKEMARSKKKPEEVTEEVVEEVQESTKRKKGGERKKKDSDDEATMTKAERRAAERKKKKKEKEEEEERTSKRKSRKEKKEDIDNTVKKLLRRLQEAKEDGGQDEARKIRAELRKKGYSLRAHTNNK